MKISKKILIILLGIIFIFNCTEAKAVNKEEVVIKEKVEEYFRLKYESLANLEFDNKLKEIFKEESEKLNALDLLEIDINWRKGQQVDYKFKDYNYNIEYLNCTPKKDECNINLSENHRIRYSCLGEYESILENQLHKIQLRKLGGTWYIVKDMYEDEMLNEFNSFRNKESNKEEFKNKYRVSNVKEKINEINIKTIDENEFKEFVEENQELKRGFSKKKYDRINAAAYAQKYALSPNGKYTNYEEMGGDCTNFVSQCIHAGGIPNDNSGVNKWYWYSDHNRWPSWTNARFFRNYLIKNNGSETEFGVNASECNFEDVEIGDIVQYANPTHSMVITGYLYIGNDKEDSYKNKIDVLISQHSIDGIGRLKDYPLGLKPTARGRYYIKLNGYYS